MRELGSFLAGQWCTGTGAFLVHSPFDRREVARISRAGDAELQQALAAAAAARATLAALPPHRRAAILETASREVASRRDELAEVIVEEAGKPVALARAEAERCAETLADAARVARTPHAELLDLGGFPSGENRIGLLRRYPIGVVAGITPFNFPLNLVAHKLAPAVAAGCPIVLKPASQTPSPALLLGEILHRAGLPAGAIGVVPCAGAQTGALLADERVRLVTFTGSAEVGWGLKKTLAQRRVTLELGGNAAVIVEPDAGDLAAVARRIATGAFGYAGQSCISVQRILINEAIAGEMRDALVAAAAACPTGDPAEAHVVCGPMITSGDADRIERWVREAESAGATRLTPWRREGAVVYPTLLEGVPSNGPLWAEEAFAPIAVLATYRTFAEALAMVNDSRFGLQAGLFTANFASIQRAHDTLEVGAIVQGDIPSWRSDPMPYGGVKLSGDGREGARWAVDEMTEPRLLVLRGA